MKRKDPFTIGKIYHIYNRGTAKCLICNNDADRWRFMQGLCLFNDINSTSSILWHLERNRGRLTMNVLKEYVFSNDGKREPLVRIMAYCLMGNHYHLLLEETLEGGIIKFMHKFGTGYAKYFNNKHQRVGTLFQGRFKSVLVDDELYLQYLLVYINVLNPAQYLEPNWKEEGIQDMEAILKFAEGYPWSTHQEYLGTRNSLIIEKGVFGEILPTQKAYLELVKMVLRDKKYNELGRLTLE